jgi:hypothetical protein
LKGFQCPFLEAIPINNILMVQLSWRGGFFDLL